MKIESILFIIFSFLLCLGSSCQNPDVKTPAAAEAEVPIFRVLTDADVLTGAEQIPKILSLCNQKTVACVVNQTSMIGQTHLVDSLLSLGVSIKTIFAPEHGFRGDADAGALVDDGLDQKTGLPIKSLYGASKKPSAKDLEGIDLVIFDIQDVGARFYTYLSTMHYIMEGCADNHVTFLLLDRPNPNGFYVDGPVLEKDFKSFVGMHPIPVVHGMTFGELAMMIKNEGWADVDQLNIELIRCEGYDHQSTYLLPVKPSPNLPNHQAIMLYPSICFFEPTTYSIGRGTEAQFQLIGEPRATSGGYQFTPRPLPGAMKPKHEGVVCQGDDLRQYDVSRFYKSGTLDLSFLLEHLSGDQINKITNVAFFDRLAGSSALRSVLAKNTSEVEIRASWEPKLKAFKELRNRYLLYD